MSVPAVSDRIVQAAARIVLEPVFEAGFLPCSFGFRPGLDPRDALQVLIDESWRGRRWVVETDIKDGFGQIPKDALMQAVEERVSDRRVLKLLRAMLLETAGFDAAMKAALRAEQALCADETPVNVIRNTGADGTVAAGSPHVVTVRTPDERLVWYAATPSRSSEALKDLGVMDGYHGILVRDDYAGWAQVDAQLAGVQQCCQHIARHLKGVHAAGPGRRHSGL